MPTLLAPSLPVATTSAGSALPLRSVEITGTIAGLDAALSITQTFENDSDTAIEVLYRFAMPPTAAVRGLTAVLNGRTVVASLAEKQQARATYDAAITAGKRAVLAEEERSDTFTMRLGNLGPREQAVCTIVLDDSLVLDKDEVLGRCAILRLPTSVAPRYTTSSADKAAVSTPYGEHSFVKIAFELDAVPASSVRFAGSVHSVVPSHLEAVVEAGADAVLNFVLDTPTNAHSRLTARWARDNKTRALLPGDRFVPHAGTLSLTLLPPELEIESGLDLLVVLDRSGSMGGWKQSLANELVARLVESLGPDDAVGVVAFDNAVSWIDDDENEHSEALRAPGSFASRKLPSMEVSFLATGARKAKLASWVRSITPRGGTDMVETLEALVSARRTEGRVLTTVIITDALVGDDDGVVAAAAALGEVRSVGICSAPHLGLLDRLGPTTIVSDPAGLDSAVENLQVWLRAPQVVKLELTAIASDGSETRLEPLAVNHLVSGVGGTVVARSDEPKSVRVEVSYQDGTRQVENLDVAVVCSSALHARWSRTLVRKMEREVLLSSRSTEDVVAVSLATGVLCSHTAFVAVGDELEGSDGEPFRVVQPNASVASWSTASSIVGHDMLMPLSVSSIGSSASSSFTAGTLESSAPVLNGLSNSPISVSDGSWEVIRGAISGSTGKKSVQDRRSKTPGQEAMSLDEALTELDRLLPLSVEMAAARLTRSFRRLADAARVLRRKKVCSLLEELIVALEAFDLHTVQAAQSRLRALDASQRQL